MGGWGFGIGDWGIGDRIGIGDWLFVLTMFDVCFPILIPKFRKTFFYSAGVNLTYLAILRGRRSLIILQRKMAARRATSEGDGIDR